MSMPTCPSCIYAHGICEKTGVEIRYSTGCSYHKPKPQTHYDLLIRKTPEELAEWLGLKVSACNENEKCGDDYTCDACWLDWLRQEADNGQN